MREMRRQDRKLSNDETKEILKNGEYGVLATVMSNGNPYSIPISYVYDEESNSIFIHCTVEAGQKIDNILNNPNVCFTVTADIKIIAESFSFIYKSANIFGKAEILKDDEQKKHGLLLLLKKYSSEYQEKGEKYIDASFNLVEVIKLSIERCIGKARKK